MKIKKSLLVAGAVATIGIAGTGAVAHATTSPDTKHSGLVDKIAQRFNLNRDDVQKVFDEDRAAHEAEHQAKLDERLSQAVKDGKLTEEQKSKILAKLEELKTSHEADMETMKDKSPEEMKNFMEQKHAELQQWAKDNNIPMEYLPLHVSVKGHPGKPGAQKDFHVHMEHSGPGEGEFGISTQDATPDN